MVNDNEREVYVIVVRGSHGGLRKVYSKDDDGAAPWYCIETHSRVLRHRAYESLLTTETVSLKRVIPIGAVLTTHRGAEVVVIGENAGPTPYPIEVVCVIRGKYRRQKYMTDEINWDLYDEGKSVNFRTLKGTIEV